MWLTCSGSLLANVAAEDDAGEDAAYGTVGHMVGETWLLSGERPTHLVGTIEKVVEGENIYEIEIDDNMLEFVEQYIRWCEELTGEHYVEQRVYFSQLTPIPHQGGTADHAACEWQVLTITDLKMGQGVPVYAAENKEDSRAVIIDELDDSFKLNGNSQGLLYALGFFYEWDWLYNFQRIVIRICQPRLDTFDVWETTREELLKFADFVKVRAALCWEPDASRTPSAKGCRWCKVRNDCTARAAFAENIVDECFETANQEFTPALMADVQYRIDEGFYMQANKIPNCAKLTTQQIAKLLPLRGVVQGFFNDLWAEAMKRALAGEAIEKHKLAEGRSDRTFRDGKAAEKALIKAGADTLTLYSLKFVSPAQAETALVNSGIKRKDAKAIVATLVVKAPGRPTLVPEQDARREYVSPADDAFETFED